MPSARDDGQTRPNTIPPENGRRSLLAGAAAVLAAAPFTASHADQLRAAGALARDTGADPDAELIRCCDRIVQLEADARAIYAVRHTLEDERRTEPALDRLYAERDRYLSAIDELPVVTTLAGARAMARASVATAEKELDGNLSYQGDAEWLAFTVAEFLAGKAA